MTICSLKKFHLGCWQTDFYLLAKKQIYFNFFFLVIAKLLVWIFFFYYFIFLFIEKTEGPCHVTENTRNSICPPKPVKQTGARQSAQGVPRHPLTGSNLPQLLSSEQHNLPGLVRH